MEKVLEKFGMNNVKPINVPLVSHFKISSVLSPRTNEEKKYMSHVPYANVVGNLMYAMVSTRLDISMQLELSAGSWKIQEKNIGEQ